MKPNILSMLVVTSVVYGLTGCTAYSAIDEELTLDETSIAANEARESTEKSKASAEDSLVISPGDVPFGSTYGEWAAAYWQWALSIPAEKNPMLGAPCDRDQNGRVFFLPGSLGGGYTQSCTISSEQAIFVPIMSTIAGICPEMAETTKVCPSYTSEASIRSLAQKQIDGTDAFLQMTIDDVHVDIVDQYRVQSIAFKDTSPENPDERLFSSCSGSIDANLCDVPVGDSRTTVADGYFVMLRPLSEGNHVIRFVANMGLNSPLPAIDVTYNILVAPPTGNIAE